MRSALNRCRPLAWTVISVLATSPLTAPLPASGEIPVAVQEFIAANCFGCHDRSTAEGGLDLESLDFDLDQRDRYDRWVLIHDRVRDGEMPPPDDGIPRPVAAIGWSVREAQAPGDRGSQAPGDRGSQDAATAEPAELDWEVLEAREMLTALAAALLDVDRHRVAESGRASARRLNRYEYENTLRQRLDAPWLRVAYLLPEDGVDHLFNKVGERLDVSHVQLERYLEVANHALRLALNAAAHPSQTRRFYARDEPSMQNYLHYRFGQTAATRSIMPLDALTPEPDVIRKLQPLTVGDADPEKRERESMGVFSGTYSATTKYDFTRVETPTDGEYRLRFKTYTFMAGPHGASGGDDHGLTGGKRDWWRPDRNVALPGTRSEPITLYALAESGDSRWLTTFDSHPEPSVFEAVVTLRTGEGIRPDAARLVRTRPGWAGNPNATPEGVPGFAMNWLEVEGPLHDDWPPRSYRALFGEQPFDVVDGQVRLTPDDPDQAATLLLRDFVHRVLDDPSAVDATLEASLDLYNAATELGFEFTESMLSTMAAILCSPDFLYFKAPSGRLSAQDLATRLAYFLWNGPPDAAAPPNTSPDQLRDSVDRMLNDPRSQRFVDSFLDYWLDLRDLNANTPDAELYTDYYLDELLTESSLLETRRFFRELIDRNLPSRNLVDSDFTYANERLAELYELEPLEGVALRRVALPDDSPRGGLLTQASVLRVTANGTTTTPVIRGAWIMERVLGTEIPPPPSGVAAVEPDTRGATTIREQLDKHRSVESCGACHVKFDPAGFALESFDVAGGWRERYRAIGGDGEKVEGIGKNGHAYGFQLAQAVDCSGVLPSGDAFQDIRELKRLLLSDERRVARNLVHRLIVYATGAAVSFSDRGEVEAILDRSKESEFGVRTLIQELVHSESFQSK